MKTEEEKETMEIIDVVSKELLTMGSTALMSDEFIEMAGDSVDIPEMMSLVVGTILGGIDALFAIRDGEEWRGITDPKEIARRLLKDAQIGEQ